MKITIRPERRTDGSTRFRLTVFLKRAHERKARRHRQDFPSAKAAGERSKALWRIARERGMDGVCDEVWGAVAPAPTRADGLVALVAKFVAQKESKGRRARSVEDLKYRLGLLTAYLGDLSARAVTLDDLEAALAKVPGVARSKINARTVWRNFFRWCWRRGAVSEPDLVRKLEPPSAPRGLPKVATAWRLWRLVAAAWHDGGTRRAPGEMLAYALMTFGSAVRPQEFCRLTWPMVNLTDALLPLDEHVTKVSMIRNVHLQPAIARALGKLKQRKLPLGFFSRRRWDRIRERAGLTGTEWAVDVGRHTYASNRYAITNEEGALAADMGNSVPVLRRFYLNRLVTAAQAKRAEAVFAAVARKAERLKKLKAEG